MFCRHTAVIVVTLLVVGACTRKPNPAAPKPTTSQTASADISDPTPPDPPNSTEVPFGLKDAPAFVVLAIGGIADEGEQEGIEMQEDVRLFRTEAATNEIVTFYAREMKARGWSTDNQIARSGKVGLTMQQYRRAGTDAMFLIVSEPEEPGSSDPAKSLRYVALAPAKVGKPKS